MNLLWSILVGLVVAACTADAAAYIKFDGVDGEADDAIGGELIEYSLNLALPTRDAATGRATGRRTYEPIVIRKELDKSSPLMMNSLLNDQVIGAASIVFCDCVPYPCNFSHCQDRYYMAISMSNVQVTSFSTNNTGDNDCDLDDDNDRNAVQRGGGGGGGRIYIETFSLNYEEIKWTYVFDDATEEVAATVTIPSSGPSGRFRDAAPQDSSTLRGRL